MDYIRLTSTEDINFQEAWKLYHSSFPQDERRELILQKKIIEEENYHFVIVKKNELFLAIILWWQFQGFRYIEHIATTARLRNNGYGQKIIQKMITDSCEPIILEVEPNLNKTANRRIAFYKRQGFKLNNFNYHQCPMRKNGAFVKLLLMSYPKYMTHSEFLSFKTALRETCFTPYLK